MKIMMEYTLDYVWRNKKNSVAIMAAIAIAAMLLSSLLGIFNTIQTDAVAQTMKQTGNWHAGFAKGVAGDKLRYITEHAKVEAVMLRGPWEVGLIEDTRRPYIAVSPLSSVFWSDMHVHVSQGREPRTEGELAVSKQYFQQNPEVRLGDTVQLVMGDRKADGEILQPVAVKEEQEHFVQREMRSYTIVGVLDQVTNSTVPAYLAYSYLDESSIRPELDYNVYMRFQDIRQTYTVTDQIAESIGIYTGDSQDTLGGKTIVKNNLLLAKHFIFPSDEKKGAGAYTQPLMFLAIALLAVAVFISIIYHAFAMSARMRIKQLGMLKSIGATPKQLRSSVLFEAFLLSIVPVPIGILAGWLLDYGLFEWIGAHHIRDPELGEIIFTFGLPAIIPALMLSILTVWLSALIPARTAGRLMPIEAMREGGKFKLDQARKRPILAAVFGIEGELAGNALSARRKAYRAAWISLTLSFALFSVFLCVMAVNEASTEQFRNQPFQKERDVVLEVMDGMAMPREATEEIRAMEDAQNVLFLSSVQVGMAVDEPLQSGELLSKGGLGKIAAEDKNWHSDVVAEKVGSYRMAVRLLTIDDTSFEAYCLSIGADAGMLKNGETPRIILVNTTKYAYGNMSESGGITPLLDIKQGDRLFYRESVHEDESGDYRFETEVGFVTDQIPPIGERFDEPLQIMARSDYDRLISQFETARKSVAQYVYVPVVAGDKGNIPAIAQKLKEIAEGWYGSGDYSVTDMEVMRQQSDRSMALMKGVMMAVAWLIALIGISNVFSTVSGNLRQRRKELALLRSVGLSPKGLSRMLWLEAMLFLLLPIGFALPLNAAFIAWFIHLNAMPFSLVWGYLPWLPVLLFGSFICLSVGLAYAAGIRQLGKETVIHTLRNEAI